ncbi:MAG: C40 family peptidase [Gemmatimonadaceae bacterium]|nr:C40 family peptidase [Gemmatimonadaceae bacterium]
MSQALIRPRTPIAPLLREPRASATQESQVLYGHVVELLAAEGPWQRVRCADGYEGWMHEGYTVAAEVGETAEGGWATPGELSLGCGLRDSAGATMDLPLGAVIREGRCVSGRAMELAARRDVFPREADAIVASAMGLFQGTYYQWGGITPWGADCSGFVQSVFALHGVPLLRDAYQQATQGVHVDGGVEAIHPADLLFFSERADDHITHVALVISSSRIVHVAVGRGGHCVDRLSSPDDYVAALMGRFRFARRIIG